MNYSPQTEPLADTPRHSYNKERPFDYARQMQDLRHLVGAQDIGPEEARRLIQHVALRYIAARLDTRVAKYASFMLLGTWSPSRKPVPLTTDGYLVKGINRLMAIIVSGTTQRMTIVISQQPVAELGISFHSGPRVCDIQSLPENEPFHACR